MKFLWQVKREFNAFFFSPIAYVVIGASSLVNAATFFIILSFLARSGPTPGAPMEMMFSTIIFWLVVMILTPLVTMRTIAEEKQSGTLETLVTAPISDVQVVLAKYVSALGFFVTMWLPTLLYPIILKRYLDLDPGPILAGYLGVFMVGVMFVAVGILCSALTRNQIIASLTTFAVIMTMYLAGFLSESDGLGSHPIFEYIYLHAHMGFFAKGIVDTRYLVCYGSVAAFCLFASVQVLGARRWRG